MMVQTVSAATPLTAPVRGTPFPSTLVNFGKTGVDGIIIGTQGNPHLHHNAGVVESIWTDDERAGDADTGDLTVFTLESGTINSGTWKKTLLPSVVNAASPSDEIQPFLDDTGLYYARLGDGMVPIIRFSQYTGGNSAADYGSASNWSAPEDILAASAAAGVNEIIAVGEPTIASRGGSQFLYFIYARVRGHDATSGLPDIDMQVGFVERR